MEEHITDLRKHICFLENQLLDCQAKLEANTLKHQQFQTEGINPQMKPPPPPPEWLKKVTKDKNFRQIIHCEKPMKNDLNIRRIKGIRRLDAKSKDEGIQQCRSSFSLRGIRRLEVESVTV